MLDRSGPRAEVRSRSPSTRGPDVSREASPRPERSAYLAGRDDRRSGRRGQTAVAAAIAAMSFRIAAHRGQAAWADAVREVAVSTDRPVDAAISSWSWRACSVVARSMALP